MLLLRDLIRDLDIRFVAGEAGLDRPVRWVHISELADPTPWLSGGELLLTTGMKLTDEASQRAFVERLATHELAGLGLGVGFKHAEAPEALREAAADHGFPLFEIPYDVPFIAVTEKAFSHLVNEQYAVLQRALSAHERLERIVLSEQGLEGVTAALAALIGGTAMVFDGRGEELARSDGALPLPAEVLAATADEVRERARAGARRGYAPSGELHGRALALPIVRAPARRERRRPGTAGVARRRQGPWRARRVRPAGAAPGRHRRRAGAAAPPGGRRHGAAARGRRALGDGLGRAGGQRARAPARAVRAARPRRRARAHAAALRPRRRRGRAQRRAARRGARAGWPPAPGSSPARCSRSSAATGDDDLFGLAERVRGRVSRAAGLSLAAGAGRAVSAGDLRRTFHEARCALEAHELAGDANGNGERRRACSPPTATSARSSCCSRCRTTRRCGCSATRSSPRSRTARAPTAAS